MFRCMPQAAVTLCFMPLFTAVPALPRGPSGAIFSKA
jgi:hypothetical protein